MTQGIVERLLDGDDLSSRLEAVAAIQDLVEALKQARDGLKYAASRLAGLGDDNGANTALNDERDASAALTKVRNS